MPYDTRMAITDALRKKTRPVSAFSVLNFEPDPEKVLYTVMLSSTELLVTGISNGWHTKLELSLCLVFALWLFFWRPTRDVAASPHLPPATYRATSGS